MRALWGVELVINVNLIGSKAFNYIYISVLKATGPPDSLEVDHK